MLTTSKIGGFITLAIQGDGKSATVSDVTGIAWLNAERLIYTAGPIYGSPGVYTYNCDSDHIVQVLGPRNRDKAYPEGTDYFELKSISDTSPVEIFFYYAPDVDKVDFKDFRIPRNLYQVDVSGNNFRKSG